MDALESRVLLSTIYVDAGAPGPSYNGSSWAAAYKDFQLALTACVSGDEIRIADGTYKPTSTTDRTISFALRDGVAIRGGYAGHGAADPDAHDIALYPTVLSGDIGTAGSKTDNSYHVLIASEAGPSAVLDSVAVTGGNANGNDTNQYHGGGLFAMRASPTLINCAFSGNSASNCGGGMYNSTSSPTLTDCTFTGNYGGSGGGVYNTFSSPTLTNCTFIGNSAGTSGGGMSVTSSSAPNLANCIFTGNSASTSGGGMYVISASPAMANCTFTGNSAGTSGGGMYSDYASSPTLANCAFTGNSATHANGYSGIGGGMYNSSSSLTLGDCAFNGNSANAGGSMYNSGGSPRLTNCTFTGSSATGIGAGVINLSASPKLTNCTFSGNSAGTSAGGMYNISSSPVLTNCTFSGNSATGSYGGGMYNVSSSPTLTNCVFSGNLAGSSGGGIFNSSSSSPTLVNCIVWGNANGAVLNSTSTPIVTYSNIQGGHVGTGNINADPLFVRSPWAGPDGLLGTADDDPGDLRLRPGSPMLDCGSNAAIPAEVSTDLAGNARIQNGTVDMGAYEGTAAPPVPRTFYVDGAATGGANTGVSWADAFISLQPALAAACDGDAIRVADGTYRPTSSTDRTISFALRNGVAIYGGYAGHGASDPDARDIALYPTILSGNIGEPGSNADNSYHVVAAVGAGASAVLDGVVVTGGNADGTGASQSYGGGLFATDSSPTLANCTFSGNWAGAGGGMYNTSSSPSLTNCIFSGNLVSNSTDFGGCGGGMYNASSSSPKLTNCIFGGNSANSGGGMYNMPTSAPMLASCTFNENSAMGRDSGVGGYGGGMYNTSSSLTLSNCTFSGNSATSPYGYGGGMYNASSSPTLTNCIFRGNSAQAGGGMYNQRSSPAMATCTFTGNSAAISGGGMHSEYLSSPTLINCTFSGNSATGPLGSGGGMANTSSSPILTDCIFSGNSASGTQGAANGGGGGMNNDSSSPTLINCTFSGNLAAGGGGGMHNRDSSPTLANCIFSGNRASSGGGMHNRDSSSPTLMNCIFSSNSATGSFGSGGGMVAGVSSTLTNCTFSGNSAHSGGGVYKSSGSSPMFTNCIFWANAAQYHPQIYESGGTITITYSNIQGGYAGTGNIDADPLFVRSPWAGPDGLFGTADDDPGDLRLRPGSPMLDCGSNAAIPAEVSTDLAGNARIQNGTVDLGAYEGTTAPPVPMTFYVDGAVTSGANTGVSWADAFTSLQSALAAAGFGDTIRMADGVYTPTSSADRTVSFMLRDGVTIYGGYAGCGASDPDARDIALYPTILSGDIGEAGNAADNSYHVVTAFGAGASTVLDCVAVTGGNANGNGTNQWYGGGLFATDSSPTLINGTFSGNSASADGGGMYNSSASPTLINCAFIDNLAGGSGGHGGGMYNHSSSPTLVNCTFNGNSAFGAHGYGGGMYNNSASSPKLINCIFTRNSATGTYNGGGGMYNTSSSPTLVNCTFIGNAATSYGGGMYNSASSPAMVNCTLSGNSAGKFGGGIYSASSGSPAILTNCIVWGNTAPNSPQIYPSSGAVKATYSNIQGGYAGTGNMNADPLFVRKSWSGADGLFGTADDDPGDVRLRPGSPMLDRGSNAAIPAGVNIDLAGNARIQNGTVEIGAYEGIVLPKLLYVDGAASGANTGVSWTDAFTTLQSALAAACDGDTIRVAKGIYKPSESDRALAFALRNAVVIYGGYAGCGAADADARDIAVNLTVLSGEIGRPESTADNSYHVLTASGAGAATVLDGVTVAGGNADGSGTDQTYGGGLFAADSSPKLVNCIFRANSASAGGGMYITRSSPMLINCTFSGNLASSSGGGMSAFSSSSLALTNCTFSGNSAIGSSASGGAIHSSSSILTLTNCILWGNAATNGSQVYQSSSSTSIIYSNVQGGYAGMRNINADPLFVRSPSAGPDSTWGTADDDFGDMRLQPGSPCIDRGRNGVFGLSGITADLAFRPRFVDIAFTPDTGTGTPPIIDLGAYETQSWCPLWLNPAGSGAWDASIQTLDIGDQSLLVAADDSNRAERLAAIRQFIAAGRAGGAGIVSSAATQDRGVVAAVDGEGSIVVRVAILGDVTLDERIDGDDYFAMDLAFLGGTGGERAAADVDLDGVVDGRDYLTLDRGFLRGVTGGVQQAGRPAAGGVFSSRSIAEELLIGEDAVLA